MTDPDASPDPMPAGAAPAARAHFHRWQVGGAVACGLAYGLAMRWAMGADATPFGAFGEVMSVAFIYGVPVGVGFVTVYLVPGPPPGWARALGTPMLSMGLVLAAAFALFWEGLICIVVWLPLALVLSAFGGAVASVVRRALGVSRPLAVAVAAALPLVLAPVEARMPAIPQTHVVEDAVVIRASAADVWREIESVPAIAPAELGGSIAHAIGFPRPIAAELEGTGVGSVRHARFEGGGVFREVVTEWDEGRALAFTIDPGAVPPETFDQHVAVGGPYFDVLDGRYVIEPLPAGATGPEAGARRVRLRLASTHRLSTTFNGYTRLWTDLFMRDIQQAILDVIRRRAERSSRAALRAASPPSPAP